jgi:prephenate dehydrogenase
MNGMKFNLVEAVLQFVSSIVVGFCALHPMAGTCVEQSRASEIAQPSTPHFNRRYDERA